MDMDKCFIPNDKFDVGGLESCWITLVEANEFDEKYFCLLAAKTFQLFFEYRKSDTIPREMVLLLAYMGAFARKAKSCSDMTENIAAAVTDDLVWQLSNYFCSIFKLGDVEESNLFLVRYKGKSYAIERNTFDLSPIKEGKNIKI